MKVLYVSHEAVLHGAPKSLLEFISIICEKGIEPIVIIPSKGKLGIELNRLGIDIRIIPYQNCVYEGRYDLKKYINYIKTNFKAIKEIIDIIREEHIDIVHSNSLAVNVGAIAACYAGVPHIWHFREFLKEDHGLKEINSILTKWLVKRSAACIAISKGIKKKYYKKYGIKIILMYNGVNSQFYYSDIQKKEDSGKTQVMIAGTIKEGKGQWDAIRAVEKLMKNGFDVHLNIVGDGAAVYINQLKKYVKENNLKNHISFCHYINDLRQLRQNSDIILVCSRMEAFGRVTAEAMMAGKIVIGCNTGGTVELVGKNEERGYLYTWNKPEELAKKIEYVITHPVEVIGKEQKAQKFILSLTDLNTYADRLNKIYQQVLTNVKGIS